jgi:hypothetical protein
MRRRGGFQRHGSRTEEDYSAEELFGSRDLKPLPSGNRDFENKSNNWTEGLSFLVGL